MAPSIVVDFAWTKPSVSQLQAWNVAAVGMYVSHDPSKNANLAVVEAYAAAGIKSFLFFEDTADRASHGYNAGASDATFAYGMAQDYGLPSWAPIIGTADFDVPDYAPSSSRPAAKLGPVGWYFKGWSDVDAQRGTIARPGYGDYYVIKRLTDAGLIDIGIQTVAWSGGRTDLADIALYQNGQMLDSGRVDVEVIESAALLSHLAWVPGEPNPLTPPPVISWSQWPAGLVLQLGDQNQAVKVLQSACRNSGLIGVRGIDVDGIFGPQTLTAVRNLQAWANILIDGIAGPVTRNVLIGLHDL